MRWHFGLSAVRKHSSRSSPLPLTFPWSLGISSKAWATVSIAHCYGNYCKKKNVSHVPFNFCFPVFQSWRLCNCTFFLSCILVWIIFGNILLQYDPISIFVIWRPQFNLVCIQMMNSVLIVFFKCYVPELNQKDVCNFQKTLLN